MMYLENIFVCIAAPLVIALFLVRGETRRFIGFFLLGLVVCLLSAYLNSYFAALLAQGGYASLTASESLVQITPVCEEVLKALPVFFFVALGAPKPREILAVALAVGLGFATLENFGYIVLQGADSLWFAVVRGFSAGVMHATCAAILGLGLSVLIGRKRLVLPGGFALLCFITTFHAIYNLLVTTGGGVQIVGYILPLATATCLLLLLRHPLLSRSQ